MGLKTINEICCHQKSRRRLDYLYSIKERLQLRNVIVAGSWSASTSPARSPSPTRRQHNNSHHLHNNPRYGPSRSSRYGTTSLCQRSRSPSPHHQGHPPLIGELSRPMAAVVYASLQPITGAHFAAGAVAGIPMEVQHSNPVIGSAGRRGGRRLPPTPSKPSTLQLRPSGPINFPKLNASPTHVSKWICTYLVGIGGFQIVRCAYVIFLCTLAQIHTSHSAHASPHYVREREPQVDLMMAPPVAPPPPRDGAPPLSFEQAVAMGRGGGRMLPSPVPNGYKPKPTRSSSHHRRRSDSDDDDWC